MNKLVPTFWKIIFVMLFFQIRFSSSLQAQLFINEVMSSNSHTIADESGVYEDWIEIYNGGNTPVDLAGYYLSDEPTIPLLSQIPAGSPGQTTVPAHGFLLLWADKNLTEGAHHINIKLSSSGEILTMTAPDGETQVDRVTFGSIGTDFSYGRLPNGGSFLQIFFAPTPGASNLAAPLPTTFNGHFISKIAGPNDDAEQYTIGSGSMILNGYKIALVQSFSTFKTGFIFKNLDIPKGSTITSANIQLTIADGGTNTSNLTIKGQNIDNAPDFTNTPLNISNRTLTTASVNWSPPSWTARYVQGPNQRTPNISPVLQEIVNRSGWNNGNNIAIVFSGTGSRSTYSYEAFPQYAAYLEVSYTAPNTATSAAGLKINEVSANATNYLDETGHEEDWLELYNSGTQPIELQGLFLSDDPNNVLKWQIAKPFTLQPGAFQTIWADEETGRGGFHANFSLSKDGEKLTLAQVLNNQISILDSVSFPAIGLKASYGRQPDGAAQWYALGIQTPNASNNAAKTWVAPPVISPADGQQTAPIIVSITHPDPTVSIRYTLDGSDPGPTAPLYTGPFTVSATKFIRARAYRTSNDAPSVDAQKAYLFNPTHNMSVVHMTTDPYNLFDPNYGIYVKGNNGTVFGYCAGEYPANFINDWERPAHLTMYEPNGTLAFTVDCGVKIAGGCSRYNDLKSLNFYMRSNTYGYSEVNYPLFYNRSNNKYKRIKLRNSGQDFQHTLFRDVLNQMVLSDKVFDLETQSYRPVVLYINDQYWGIMDMREIYGDNYFKRLYDINEDELDVLKNPILLNEIDEGSDSDYREFWDWFNTHNVTDSVNFEYAKSKLDINNALNYWMSMDYISSHDWPANNVLIWRKTTGNGKWRYAVADTDASTSIYGETGSTGYAYDALTYSLDPNATGFPNDAKATLFFRKLMQNQWFKEEFIQRTCTFMELQWNPVKVGNLIDSIKNILQPEIPAHLTRWTNSLPYLKTLATWQSRVAIMKNFWIQRPAYWRNIVKNKFSLTGSFALHFNYTDQTPGTVFINSNKIEIPFGYTGTYYQNVPIEITAVADQGHTFSYWLETGETNPTIHFKTTQSAATLTPIFDDNTQPLNQTINFPAIAGKLTTDAPFAISAIASSGLPVSFSIVSGPATISGNTITLSGTAGVVQVKASQAGNSQYNPAPDVINSFQVSLPALLNQTIAFPAIPNKINTDAPFTISATASSGLPVVFSIVSGPATIAGNTITLTGATGSVTVKASQAGNAQYNPAPDVSNTFQVTQATLQNQTITFAAIPSKLPSSPPFTVSATASSGLPVSFSIVSGPATISGNTITLTGATGTVSVRAFQAGNAQYNPAPDVIRTFSVSPAQQTYCASVSSYPWHEWISKVQLNSINNVSSKAAYSNFTNISTTLLNGSNYPLSLTINFSYATYNEYCRVWIDYDKNGVFDDTEVAYEGILNAPPTGTPSAVLSGTITVPMTATAGSTRMRVSLKRGAFPLACETLPYGEVEDYSISIATSLAANPGQIDDYANLFLDVRQDIEQVILSYGIATDAELRYTVLEKSIDDVQYDPLMILFGSDALHGIQYDAQPVEGINYYKAKFVLADTVVYSPVGQIDFRYPATAVVFPNPTRDQVNMYLYRHVGKAIDVSVTDLLGRQIYREKIDNLDTEVLTLDASQWPNGVYNIFVSTDRLRPIVQQVVVFR